MEVRNQTRSTHQKASKCLKHLEKIFQKTPFLIEMFRLNTTGEIKMGFLDHVKDVENFDNDIVWVINFIKF